MKLKQVIIGIGVIGTILLASIANNIEAKAWGNQSTFDTQYTFNKAYKYF